MTNSPLLNITDIIKLLLFKKVNKSKILDIWRKKEESAIFLSKSSWSLALISLLKKKRKTKF